MKRLNKEYSLDFNDYIDVKYGSIDKNNPCVIFLEGKTWIEPNYNGNYISDVNGIVLSFKDKLRDAITNSCDFYNKFIFDFDVKTASLRENKKSFVSFEFLVRQSGTVKSLSEIKPIVVCLFKDIINDLTTDFNNHIFSLSKRK